MSSVFLSFSYSLFLFVFEFLFLLFSQLEAIHLFFLYFREKVERIIYINICFPFLSSFISPLFLLLVSQLVSLLFCFSRTSFVLRSYETKKREECNQIRLYIERVRYQNEKKKKRESQIHKVNKMMNVSLFFSQSLSLSSTTTMFD